MNAGFCTIFVGTQRVARVSNAFVASVARQILAADPGARVLVFDDATGRQVDPDFRESPGSPAPAAAEAPRGRGRPKLGVVAREVTLLPRHWDWLNGQPGGASVALRKLVENALHDDGEASSSGWRAPERDAELIRRREAREAAYRFLSAMGGDLPGFEEAARALFAEDRPRFARIVAAWPGDVAAYARWLAFGEGEG
ncbi:DUF2239 family protein [Rhodoblastus sp.]|uniref:DUF2239 family protein n=1 Tax=Rhodoblastus sp. TaxID=1962975 RepID=UPI002620EF02|nr:DUF2239 family protein [Rhodoblastus sp.]